jgi:hypothetical protein
MSRNNWLISDEIADEILNCLKAGMTEKTVIDLLRLMRLATERGHPNVKLPIMPKVERP